MPVMAIEDRHGYAVNKQRLVKKTVALNFFSHLFNAPWEGLLMRPQTSDLHKFPRHESQLEKAVHSPSVSRLCRHPPAANSTRW